MEYHQVGLGYYKYNFEVRALECFYFQLLHTSTLGKHYTFYSTTMICRL